MLGCHGFQYLEGVAHFTGLVSAEEMFKTPQAGPFTEPLMKDPVCERNMIIRSQQANIDG
jgi:hypothetical protein